ncbi:MAG TPA: carboxypeptidase regulatory-like domain-containing protein, partial [Thermoanaerobaculia bacterium]|nr:carboxypeptidase regulatory-like domain-containing protein [Thermoanaerobaculia bacterium]
PFQLTLHPKAENRPGGYGGCQSLDGDCESTPSLPLPGVILFPTDISLLHQFFAVILMVQNGAPAGDPLVLRDLSARVTLPPGLRQASTLPPTPLGVPIPIRVPGPDGILGTADDITFLVAQSSGEAQVLTEGIEQGTQIVQFDIEGVVDGLPGGQLQTITGHAQGAVVVRDPTLNVTVTHPEVVRADEQYQLLLTVTNTGNSPANQLTLRLPPAKLAGVQVVGNNSQTIDLLPGDSQLVEFTLVSLLTGRVVADAVRNSNEITPTFDLSVGVGENNIPLSPNAIILPDAANSLPPDLLRADLNLVGLGYSLATAPVSLLTPGGLPQVTLGAIDSRIYELAQAGVEVTMGEAQFDSAAILAALWTGAQDQDATWDQLRRITQKGGAAGARLGAIFAAEAAAGSPAAAFSRFAATTAFLRRPAVAGGAVAGGAAGVEGALATGAGATLRVTSRATGLRLAGGGDDPARLRELPFADLYLLDSQGGAQMALLAVPETAGYLVELRIAGGGTAGLELLVPAADGSLRLVSWSGVALAAAGKATVAYAPADAAFTLLVDPQGTGAGTQQLAGNVTPLAARPFGVVAAMQNSVADPTGHVVDVLFTGDVDPASLLPLDPAHFVVAGKVSNGGLTRVDADIVAQSTSGPAGALHNSRLLRVVFNNPLSPLAVPVNLTVVNVKSLAGETFGSVQLAVRITVTTPGEQVSGVVVGSNGQPVPFAQVTLHENDFCLMCGESSCSSHKTAIVQADATGRYLFDYVRSTQQCGDSFGLSAADPASNEVGVATGRVRFIGQTARLDVLMLGRGTIRGRVAYDDGTVPDSPQVVAWSPVFREYGSVKIDAHGNYAATNVAVGTITLSASDSQGRFVVTTLAVPSSGSVVDYDLIILRIPPKPVVTGQVSGLVVRPDGTTPVVLAYVALYVDGNLISVERTDTAGTFDFGIVPAGQAEIDTFENETGQSGVQVFFQIKPDQANQVKLTMNPNRGAVEGHVYRQTGSSLAPIAGAVVWVDGTPFKTFTDTQGFYHLDGVFTGTWNIFAADLANQVSVSQAVTIETEGATATRDLYFQTQLPSGFAGQVLDFNGNPVAGAVVHLGAGSQNWWGETATDSTGTFTYTGLAPGGYTVYAYRGLDGGSAGVTIRFAGDTPFVTIRFKAGTIKGVVQAKDVNGNLTGLLATVTYRTTVVRQGLLGLANDPTTIQTAADGTFEIDRVLAGPYQLSAYNSFYGSQSVSGQIVNQGEVQHQTLTFQQNGPGTIKGIVLDQDGVTPAAGASVHLAHPAFSTYDLTAGADGSFEFDFVPPTVWTFPIQVTFQSGVIFREAQVYVSFTQPAQTLTLQIVLPKQGSVAGLVKDADGHPVPGSVVTLAEGHYPYRQLTVNAD